jgi:hydroxymethylglutaryl-CoA lyase
MNVEIIEVGPRDGLQNENQILSHIKRSQLVKKLSETGLKRIEVGAFVSPKWVPQMEDSLKVAKSTKNLMAKDKSLNFSALVPNERGMKDFLKSPLKELSVFTSSTESFSQKNINCSIDESFERFKPVIKEAKKNKVKVRGYLSTVFGCPFEGKVSPKTVVKLVHRLFEAGVYEVSLGDTIGVATPKQIKEVLKALESSGIKANKLAGHYHDTRGTALSNVIASLDFGVKKFDSCVGGLGGCPYAPGAAGNLATEDLVYTMNSMGLKTNVDLNKMISVARWLQNQVGHPITSHLAMSGS